MLGRVRSVRTISSKLMFFDIERAGLNLQIMVEQKKLNTTSPAEVQQELRRVAHVGDWIYFQGHPTRTKSGQLTLATTSPPRWIAPCLQHLPDKAGNAELLARYPHLHQLTSKEPGEILRLRATIYDHLRKSLSQDGFLEVETPMFDVRAGGAIARPFETVANELSNTPIRLRIAPELNLKRLIVGGQDRVFEIGRAFRNEGVDNTHNPEFSTCEFYQVGATLSQLIERTEKLVQGLHATIEALRPTHFSHLTAPDTIDFSAPFKQLPFIPTIEEACGRNLPNLSTPTATDDVLAFFKELDIPVPPNPTLPRLLDVLAETYIEPLCVNPTFITSHPEALSPLSKSYIDPSSKQIVAARAELFINGREYVNAYEEENSPFEQRRKFQQQLALQPDAEDSGKGIDESYLEVLEWGMPPTGGWGCGLDRLVMLFSGKKRIADVLPFGTLRNVVSISKNNVEEAKKAQEGK
ncbi:lysyl-tRNA synthetase-like protein [Periconia macrospinosa]|uniref:Lysyl-tRNA synthetase-like protein n=1 Tax=Periconia macrospinosa TaxID=97972 RepID=A0A2V1D9L9_9PLEO|nr:lysyl-tRNA synthetase-like protein [Periconia macrospinosa]